MISHINKEKALREIADEIGRCPLCKQGGTGKAVPGEGDSNAQVMLVGEAPGSSEAETGRPFVGRAGKFLRAAIRDIGIDESSIFVTSPVHYLPLRGKPSRAMIEHGTIHLTKQIEIIRPRIIVLLGNTACRALLNKNIEIAKLHGSVVEKEALKFFISFHPAYANRFPKGRTFIDDLRRLKELLNEKS